MMSADTIRSQLIALERQHAGDHDEGYRLAEALVRLRSQTSAEQAQAWDGVLLEWTLSGEARLWGVALEALARVPGDAESVTDRALLEHLAEAQSIDEYRSYLALTLIRRGIVAESLPKFVYGSVARELPMGMALLAALLKVAPEQAPTGAQVLEACLSRGRDAYVRTGVAPLVGAAQDVGLSLLSNLIGDVRAIHAERGETLAQLLSAHLAKPFVERCFTSDDLDEFRRGLLT